MIFLDKIHFFNGIFTNAFFQFPRDFPDIAARGFLHCDFIGQKFICYLLKKTGILMMYRLEKSNSPDVPTVGKSTSIPAKDAINISVCDDLNQLLHLICDIF